MTKTNRGFGNTGPAFFFSYVSKGATRLEIECETCKAHFNVKGHTTPDGLYDSGEVVTELECADELCKCLMDGGQFTVVDESHASFDDDVI